MKAVFGPFLKLEITDRGHAPGIGGVVALRLRISDDRPVRAVWKDMVASEVDPLDTVTCRTIEDPPIVSKRSLAVSETSFCDGLL